VAQNILCRLEATNLKITSPQVMGELPFSGLKQQINHLYNGQYF